MATGDLQFSTATNKPGFILCNGQTISNATHPDLAAHMATFGEEYIVSETETKVFDCRGQLFGGALPGQLGQLVGDGIIGIPHLPLNAMAPASVLTSNSKSIDCSISSVADGLTSTDEPLPQTPFTPQYRAVNVFIEV